MGVSDYLRANATVLAKRKLQVARNTVLHCRIYMEITPGLCTYILTVASEVQLPLIK